MAIATTNVFESVFGNVRVLVQKHATPGTGANEVATGADYVFAVTGNCGTTPDKALVLTPNTSDHSIAALGSYTLEAEADVTCYTVAYISG